MSVDGAHRFQDGRDAGLVVTTQDGGSVRPDDVAVDHRIGMIARGHRVHVRAQEQRRRIGDSAREARDQVAGVGTDALAGIVDFHPGPHVLERGREPPGDLAFALRHAADPGELEELVDQALAVDHRAAQNARRNHSRLRLTAWCRCAGSVSRWSPPGMTTRSQGGAACACRATPCSRGTTSSASPWMTRWSEIPAGAWAKRPVENSRAKGTPSPRPSSRSSFASSVRLAGARQVTTGHAGCSATAHRATKPPRLEPRRPKRPSSAGCVPRWERTISRSSMRLATVVSVSNPLDSPQPRKSKRARARPAAGISAPSRRYLSLSLEADRPWHATTQGAGGVAGT